MEIKLSGAQTPILTYGIPFSLCFSTCARVRGKLTAEEIRTALERLRIRHPLLAVRAAVSADKTSACYTTDGVPEILLRVMERSSDDAWISEVEGELPQAFNYRTGPPFRCVWLNGGEVSDILLLCDHLTADGRAAIFALRDLLSLIADPALRLPPIFPEPIKELLRPEMVARIEEIVTEAIRNAPKGPPRFPDLAQSDPLRVLPFALSREETDALVARSRKEQTTVQAALCAAFTIPFAERETGVPVRRMESPMDIRGRFGRPMEDAYGNYISLIMLNLNCAAGRNPWEIAREARHALQSVSDEVLFTIPTILMAVASRPIPMMPVEHGYDVSISNLGRIDIPEEYGRLRLESIFSPTMNVSMAGHRILGVSTFAGQMRCTFTSRDPQAPQILARARQILAEMVQGS